MEAVGSVAHLLQLVVGGRGVGVVRKRKGKGRGEGKKKEGGGSNRVSKVVAAGKGEFLKGG